MGGWVDRSIFDTQAASLGERVDRLAFLQGTVLLQLLVDRAGAHPCLFWMSEPVFVT